MRKYGLLFATVFALAGCKSQHDKTWYMQHDTERSAKVKECNNDAAKRVTADCENAISADQQKRAFGDTENIKTPDFGLKQ